VLGGSQKKLQFSSLHSINVSIFIINAESVYCAVRTGSSTETDTVSSFKVNVTKMYCIAMSLHIVT